MPVPVSYPGVYIEELPSSVRTIVGVPTAVTAFVGPALRGPADQHWHVTSWADFERVFGGLWSESLMSYAVYHYYQNGGSEAEIVRVTRVSAAPASLDMTQEVKLSATSEGTWGNRLRARVEYPPVPGPALAAGAPAPAHTLYSLTIRDTATGAEERYPSVSINQDSPNRLDLVLQASLLVRSTGKTDALPDASAPVPSGQDPFADQPAALPAPAAPPAPAPPAAPAAPVPPAPAPAAPAAPAPGPFAQAQGGLDGATIHPKLTDTQYVDPQGGELGKQGIYALLDSDIFNILCLPPIDRLTDFSSDTLAAALNLCVARRAILVVDPPVGWTSVTAATGGAATPPVHGDTAKNAAIFFPRLRMPDPLQNGQVAEFPPCGAIAGIFARTDAQRGVWKAPAGTDASINGVTELTVKMTDLENGELNPLGINCLRTFPVIGTVVWGARTLRGADVFTDQWKYLPVRRLALYVEETLRRDTQWVVFEPNDEPLWAAIRLNVGAFMNSLFRQGAFQGRTPQEAYLVKCDKENNPQNDIDRGIVNIVVGFAPLKPAEFVIIHIQQLAGQLQV